MQFIDLVASGDDDSVRAAVSSNGALASARGEDGVSVLSKLVYVGRGKLARELATGRSDLDVFEASCVGDVARVRALASGGASLEGVSPDGFSLQGYAAFFGHLELLEFLLSAGADCESASQNPMHVRPIHSAVAHRDPAHAVRLSRLLLEHRADPNARQQARFALLHEAVFNGNAELVALLMQHGADPALENDEGESPLSQARAEARDEIVRLLETGRQPGNARG
jgi:ankyrin repeat protein